MMASQHYNFENFMNFHVGELIDLESGGMAMDIQEVSTSELGSNKAAEVQYIQQLQQPVEDRVVWGHEHQTLRELKMFLGNKCLVVTTPRDPEPCISVTPEDLQQVDNKKPSSRDDTFVITVKGCETFGDILEKNPALKTKYTEYFKEIPPQADASSKYIDNIFKLSAGACGITGTAIKWQGDTSKVSQHISVGFSVLALIACLLWWKAQIAKRGTVSKITYKAATAAISTTLAFSASNLFKMTTEMEIIVPAVFSAVITVFTFWM